MKKVEGQYQIKKKWFNNKGTFVLEQQGKKVVGTFVYGGVENKIDMGRFNGDRYFEFCGSFASKFGPKIYSFTGNITNYTFEGNFETKKGVKKVHGTLVIDGVGAPAPETAAATEATAEASSDDKKDA